MRKILSEKSIRFLSLFLFVPLWISAQNITVTGKVTDKTGEPLIGVTVTEKGTSNGVASDVDGSYSLTVPRDATLDFSYVGYLPQSVSVQGKSLINVVLQEDTKALSEVVVIGYGTQRREAVTGSVASIGGNAMRDVPAGNITNALQGRVAGVQMSQTSTKPGSTMQIRIRGTRSINATNDPLVVLDGIPFPGTISDISPDDIKSIDILKDASATAIYGSRGANGVILVTTYNGFKNQKAQVSYSGYYGWAKAIKYPMMNATDYAAMRQRAGLYMAQNGVDPAAGADEPVDPSTGAFTQNTDWQNLFFQTGMVTNHDLNVMGGSETGSYKFGAGFYDNQAVVPGQWYKRYSIRGSLDQKIGIFRVGFTTNNNFNVTNGSSISLYSVLNASPLADPYNADGTLKTRISQATDVGKYVLTRQGINDLINNDLYANQTKAFGSYNSVYGELSIPGVDGLKVRVNLGANYRQSNGGTYTGEGVINDAVTAPNSASISNSLTYGWTDENLITYDHAFGKNQINAVALYSVEQNYYNSSSISRKNIAFDSFLYYNLGQSSTSSNDDITINPSSQGYSVSGLESWMGRVMYSYDDRYMISATIRSDGSSRLAPGYQWHTYPAVSAGWNIAKEAFMKNVSWIDEMKLRLGWGQTSNQAVAPYSTLGTLSTMPYNFGSTGYATGYYVNQLPNPSLGWEYSKTTNAGLDFTLFKNRLSGTFEYYVTNTHGLLFNVNMPPSSGVNGYTGNVGSTQNKGWELTLNGTIIKSKDWQWDAGVNFAANRNKIVALSSGLQQDVTDWLFVGHPINVVYDYQKIGIWQQNDPYLNILVPGGTPGMIKVKYLGDYNPDGSPTRSLAAADQVPMDADPNFTGGFNTRVAWKGLDLTMVGTFQNGGILNSTLYGSNGYLDLLSGRGGQINVDYWTPTNTSAKFPDPSGMKNSNNPQYGSTLGYFNASYFKIGTMTLGYNFDKKSTWIQKAGIERLRVYLTVQNLLTLFSPYYNQSGMDPQTNSYANDGSMMAVAYSGSLSRLLTVGYNTPCTHNYMIGLNVTF